MAEFYEKISVNTRVLISVLSILLLMCFAYLIRTYSTANQYRKMYQKEIDAEKNRQLKIIEQKEKKIDSLLNANKKQDLIIFSSLKSIDSLKKVKNKVIIEYRERIIDIDNLNAEQIEKYWQNEFKN